MLHLKTALLLLLSAFAVSTAQAQSVVSIPIIQHAPLQAVTDSATISLPAGGLTVGSSLTVTGGDGHYTYLWTNAEGQTLGSNATLHIADPGDYYLKVIDGAGCAVSVKFTANVSSGITPAQMQFTIQRQGDQLAISPGTVVKQVRIVNMGGSLMREVSCKHQQSTVTVSLSGLQQGPYAIAVVLSNGKTIIRRIIIK
jgi:hypothetical protein